jgi:thymidylate synthase (FAD)
VDQKYCFDKGIIDATLKYRELIQEGVKKEDARLVLPEFSRTSLLVVGNFQAWVDFIRLRATKEAQWEIRAVAEEIKAQLMTIAPNIFGNV